MRLGYSYSSRLTRLLASHGSHSMPRLKHSGSRKREYHGKTGTREHRSWLGAIDRCLNPHNQYYHRYGGRGIAMCQEWLESFATFLRDMGPRPEGMTLERKRNDEGYNPSNCVWATLKQQGRNRGNTPFIEHGGLRLSIMGWAERKNMPVSVLRARLKLSGRSTAEVMDAPYIKGQPLQLARDFKRGSTSLMLTIDGVTKTHVDWGKAAGISAALLRSRMKKGMTPKQALSTPSTFRRKSV